MSICILCTVYFLTEDKTVYNFGLLLSHFRETVTSNTNMAREVTAVLSSSIVEQRQATLQEFSDVINAASRNLDGILKEIGWSTEDIQSKEPLATCPINPQHRMVESSLQHHIERCKWARDGYTREEQEESASLEGNSFFCENKKAVHAVELDADSQKEIMSRFAGTSSKTFPRTMDRLDAEFSPDQRLAIYEKIREKIQNQADKLDLEELEFDYDPDKKDDEDKEKPKTHAEVLAEMRDYRRRRQSYRAKNVHITKKSKTDVMRDIIDAHMKFLEETLNSAKEEEEERKHERTHSRSREGSSSSSRDSRDHHRRGRSRSRDRSSRRDDRSRSSSHSRDSRSHHHRHHSKHSKHKHKSRHRSPSHEEFE